MKQLDFSSPRSRRTPAEILAAVRKLREYHAKGILGGARMPEDANPGLPIDSRENYLYFTLPMALNYQRDAYKLWKAAHRTFEDPEWRFVFIPEEAVRASEDEVRQALTIYGLALQPTKHIETWRRLCTTLTDYYQADVRNLLKENDFDVPRILGEIQENRKKGFPYLSGPKISNYWLYVLANYTDVKLKNRSSLSVAPDTHVIQASIKLGLVEDCERTALQALVTAKWKEILSGSEFCPIDIHTPLWLWSRNNFDPSPYEHHFPEWQRPCPS